MSSLVDLEESFGRALDENSVEDVLSIVTGVFVGLVTEVVRRQGYDANEPITIDGQDGRDITIHATKDRAA